MAGVKISEKSSAAPALGTMMVPIETAAGDPGKLTLANIQQMIKPAWLRKTAAYSAASGDRIKASTTAGAWDLTFPGSPADGDEVEIQDVDGTFNTNNLTCLCNGDNIMGFTTSLVLDERYLHVCFVYDATLGDWRM